MALPTSGAAWTALSSRAAQAVGAPDISNQDNQAEIGALAKALVYVRTGSTNATYRSQVIGALQSAIGTEDGGRTLALGRNLGSYVLAADLIGYREPAFVSWVTSVRTETLDGMTLVTCSERRGNNWHTWCMASRIAAERYLGLDLARSVQVFRGWLGDRSQYAGFSWGDPSWQCDASAPVGINPPCLRSGFDIGGVIPDDQRRTGGFTTDPPCGNYTHEALQGVTLSGALLGRQGYDAWGWSQSAIRRAFTWLYTNDCPASGDDSGNPWVVNHFAGSSFPAGAVSPGKGWSFQDWLFGG